MTFPSSPASPTTLPERPREGGGERPGGSSGAGCAAAPLTRAPSGSLVPSRNRRGEPLRQIPGMTPSLLNLPAGLRPAPPLPARRGPAALNCCQWRIHGGGRLRPPRDPPRMTRRWCMSEVMSHCPWKPGRAHHRDRAALFEVSSELLDFSRVLVARLASCQAVDETVIVMDGVDLTHREGRGGGALSAKAAAANPPWGAWSPASCRRARAASCRARPRPAQPERGRGEEAQAAHPDDLPGPRCLAQPAA